MAAAPFSVDLANQIAQKAGFQGIVEETMANNNRLKGVAETAMTANQGQMSVAFQGWMEELVTHATINNQKLDSIVQALGFGIQSTSSTDEGAAATLRSGGFFR
jgi:hypothetical protein